MTSNVLTTVTGDYIFPHSTLFSHFDITSTGLRIQGNPTYEQWEAFGKDLGHNYSGIQWTVGDWLNEGENRYGEKYAQAADDICFAPGTLRNYASICARIPMSVRDARLHFHRTKYVAPLMKSEQHLLIQFAIEHHLTGEDIKSLVDKQLNRQSRNMATIEGTITERYGSAVLVRLETNVELKVGQVVVLRVK